MSAQTGWLENEYRSRRTPNQTALGKETWLLFGVYEKLMNACTYKRARVA